MIFGKSATNNPDKAVARSNNMVLQAEVTPASTIGMIAAIAVLVC